MPIDPSDNWRRDLVTAYADLFGPSGDPEGVPGSPNVGDGWEDLLRRACARILAAVVLTGGTFRATQIKEKYGPLRFYWTGDLSAKAAAAVEEAIDLAEARSATTCEVCGEPGVLRGGPWLTTRCDAHAEGRPAIATRSGEEAQAVQRVVGGKRHVRHRRYDRDRDMFVDVDPPGSDAEEE
jgi:hypothetical protein